MIISGVVEVVLIHNNEEVVLSPVLVEVVIILGVAGVILIPNLTGLKCVFLGWLECC